MYRIQISLPYSPSTPPCVCVKHYTTNRGPPGGDYVSSHYPDIACPRSNNNNNNPGTRTCGRISHRSRDNVEAVRTIYHVNYLDGVDPLFNDIKVLIKRSECFGG